MPRWGTELWSLALAVVALGWAVTARGDDPTGSAMPAADLEARVRQLEATNARLLEAVETLSRQVETLSRPTVVGAVEGTTLGVEIGPEGEPDLVPGGEAGRSTTTPEPESDYQMPGVPPSRELSEIILGPGFTMGTENDEYQIQFHNLTQIDGRFYQPGNQTLTPDTFDIARQWFILSGRLSKPYEYYASIAQGGGGFNVLDAFLNVHYDDRVQFRAGRFRSPFTYEWYAEPVANLINPERSLFGENFALSRATGLMGWGQLFDKRLDYAAGVFNGGRNLLIDRNDAKDVAAFVNFAPFLGSDRPLLEHLNVGGSVNAGRQSGLPVPQALRTANVGVAGMIQNPEFLAFNNDVREVGQRAFWSLHLAYYVRHLSLIGEWQSGYQTYERTMNAGILDAVAGGQLLRPVRLLPHRRDGSGPGTCQAASAAGPPTGSLRPGGRRVDDPL